MSEQQLSELRQGFDRVSKMLQKSTGRMNKDFDPEAEINNAVRSGFYKSIQSNGGAFDPAAIRSKMSGQFRAREIQDRQMLMQEGNFTLKHMEMIQRGIDKEAAAGKAGAIFTKGYTDKHIGTQEYPSVLKWMAQMDGDKSPQEIQAHYARGAIKFKWTGIKPSKDGGAKVVKRTLDQEVAELAALQANDNRTAGEDIKMAFLEKKLRQPEGERVTPVDPEFQQAGTATMPENHDWAGQEVPTRFSNKGSRAGEYEYKAPDGKWKPVPPGTEIHTKGYSNKGAVRQKVFYEMADEVHQNIVAAEGLKRLWRDVKTGPEGIALIVTQITNAAKAALGNPNMTDEELATATQEGELNRKIGQFRREVVGGGVMTEKDAERVASALGGEPSMWRRKGVVAEMVKRMLRDKVRHHNEVALPAYLAERNKLGRESSMPDYGKLEFDESWFSDTRNATPRLSQENIAEEYKKLSPGDKYYDPNGKLRTKR